ncbi:MAG: cadmium-translocating P-type ATPase [Elusimicrobia bacterium]|nr:cadmium-translocating P-type ATPase [Elusimicrobiota bacterium]
MPTSGLRASKRSPPRSWEIPIASLAIVGISLHLLFRYLLRTPPFLWLLPLHVVLLLGGVPLLAKLSARLWARDLGSDLLAGVSIVISGLMGEYLVGSILVLMMSGGGALEQLARRRASAVLEALARRMPQVAHRKQDSALLDIPLEEVRVDDTLVVFPHEICPVDGIVLEGHGRMDEAYLTGEPFEISKTPGSEVLSGAINGESALVIGSLKLASDSRYAKITKIIEASERSRPRIRRLGDQLGAWYAPLTLALAAAAGFSSGDSLRFLSVLVVATPCPLLIAIPVAVIGAISLCAKRGIIIKNPAVLEQITGCSTVILDKTGTLTYGRPSLTEVLPAFGFTREQVLQMAASLERYSRHPLAAPILKTASEARLDLLPVNEASEKPGDGLGGVIADHRVLITGRNRAQNLGCTLPPLAPGLECFVLIDGAFAAAFRFHDEPRSESKSFLRHLFPKHGVTKILLVSGDKESEVRYLADTVGIGEVYANQSPEEKVAIVAEETCRAKTLFVGDGINDAPALLTATVGVALGPNSDIASEAADAVILTASIGKIDELIHIGRRMLGIALQSSLGGMALSVVGMFLAATGHLQPLQGVVLQEVIDLAAVLNAVRVAMPPRDLTDF